MFIWSSKSKRIDGRIESTGEEFPEGYGIDFRQEYYMMMIIYEYVDTELIDNFNENYKEGVNVADQTGVDVDSHLQVYKQLTLLRSTYNFSSTVLYSTKEVNIIHLYYQVKNSYTRIKT